MAISETLRSPGQEPEINSREHITVLEARLLQRTTRESLSIPGWSLWTEKYPKAVSGLSGVVAHFGERIERADMDRRIEETLSQHPESIDENWVGPVGYGAGFGAIYRSPESSIREEKDAATFEVALKLATHTLELKGWSPNDVDIVDFANSAADQGMSATLKQKLIDDLGMRNDLEVTGSFMACDGAGNALFSRLSDETSKGKNVLLLTVDSVGSEMPMDPKYSDTNSQQIFSNGAASLAYIPGKDLRLLTPGKTEVHQDVNNALGAVARYSEAIDSDSTFDPNEPTGLVRRIGNERMIILPHPANDGFLMRGKETARFFWEYSEGNIAQVVEQYEQAFPDRALDHAVVHQPSYPVFKGLAHRFEKRIRLGKQKLELPFKWVVPDGNSSGATSLIAFNRVMTDFKPQDHVMYASFGAGGSFTSFIVEVGKNN